MQRKRKFKRKSKQGKHYKECEHRRWKWFLKPSYPGDIGCVQCEDCEHLGWYTTSIEWWKH